VTVGPSTPSAARGLPSIVAARSEDPETKQAYSFPYGDFRRVHRSGVIAGESRAGQHDHDDVEDALKKLLDLIDGD
jgi:hypothetical protein